MTKKFFTYTALLLLLGLGGCAGAPASETVPPENDTALETYNRAMFSFNNKLDKFVIRPVAKGYRAVTNEYFRQRVTNFFSNIDEPISAANHILQGELADSGNNLGRFVINTTFGLVGLYDVASSMGMERIRPVLMKHWRHGACLMARLLFCRWLARAPRALP